MIQWRINGHALEVLDPAQGTWGRLCDAFGITRIMVDLLSGVHEVEVYVDSAKAGLNKALIDRSMLKKTRVIDKLYALGLQLLDGDDDIPIIQQILFESEQSAPVEYQHERLGFTTLDGQEVFLLDAPLGTVDPMKAGSRYSISKLMTPRGSLDEWKTLMQAEILGRPPLEMAMAIGAVAPVAHLLRAAGAITDLPIVAYIGPSTTGKTCALRAGASIWGFPMESVGIIDDLNSTENAFFETLARNVGVPAFIDETSAQPDWNFGKTMYFLPKGRSKRRCDASGDLRKTKVFSGAAIFTGEHSLLQQVEHGSGQRARIVEFTLDKWTEDAEHAERVTEGCCQTYGVAAPVLVQWLMDHRDELPKLFAAERQELVKHLRGLSAIEERVLKIHAMILVAAHAIREAVELDLNVASIRSLMLEQVEERPKQDPQEVTYNSLLETIAANGSKFIWPSKRTADYPTGKDAWGVFEYRKSTPCVWIGLDCFTKMLKKVGIQSFREITAPFAEKGWLVDFGSRHYFRDHKINGLEVKAVCLLLPGSPNLFERLDTLSPKAPDHELVRVLRGESFEASLCSGQADVSRELQQVAGLPDEKMVIGFSAPCSQGEVLILNKKIEQSLGLREHVFVTVMVDEKLLLLSSGPVAQSSVKLKLNSWHGNKICSNSRAVRKLLQTLQMELPIGNAVAFTDIDIDEANGQPVAVTGADPSNPIGVTWGQISGWEFPIEERSGGSQLRYLLDEHEDD